MIVKNLKVFLQNVQKNRLLTDTILETDKYLDILFIQKLSWSFIYTILSSSSKERDRIVDTPNYPNWLTFSRPSTDNSHPRMISYINTRLSHMWFSLRKDIFNHRDINCISFFNNGNILFMINIYSNNHQLALNYLKNTEANLCNFFIITSDFNIRDSNCNSSYPFHLIYSDTLLNIADLFDFKLSYSI